MAMSDDERRCVGAGCALLSELVGGSWVVAPGPTLDELNPRRPSPEVTVTNGSLTAAIEVTELRGGETLNDYVVSLSALRKASQPSVRGGYLLIPSDDFSLPIPKAEVARVKSAVERAAREITPDKTSAPVRRPRSAPVSLVDASLAGHVSCCHNSMHAVLMQASRLVSGAFMLVDCDQYEHAFCTAEAKRAAALAIANACSRRLTEGLATAEWDEEWNLELLDPDGTGVDVLCSSGAFAVAGVVDDDVARAVRAKASKFVDVRWADLHVLVLDARYSMFSEAYVASSLASAAPSDLASLDLVLLVHDDQAATVWRRRDASRCS